MRWRSFVGLLVAIVMLWAPSAIGQTAVRDQLSEGIARTYSLQGKLFTVRVESVNTDSAVVSVRGWSYNTSARLHGSFSEGRRNALPDASRLTVESIHQGQPGFVRFYLWASPLPAGEVAAIQSLKSTEGQSCMVDDDCSVGSDCRSTCRQRACEQAADCPDGMDCLSLKCQAVLGSWHPRIAVPGVEGLTDYNLRRLALTTGDVLKGFTSTFTLYGYSHTATLLEAFPSELPRRAVLLIDGVKTREFRLTDDEKSMSTGRLLNNYYAFDDGTFLYVKEVSPGHGSGRPSASVRFAKPFVDGEHYLWATYNTSFGICVTHGECPSNRRCVDGICIAYCGNLVCEAGEDCPEDCASCGDARCSGGETCTTCARDCGPCQTCGDNVCSEVEGCGICPTDCGCPSLRRCEENSCVTFCGNQECEDGEECLDDCGRTMFRGKTLEVQGGGFMVEGASARVEGTLKLVNEELLFEGSRIEVTPDAIGSYLQAVTEEVTLRSGEGGPFYAVRATRRGRLLAIIPVTMVFEAHVSAEDGDILAMELPWWHVLVS